MTSLTHSGSILVHRTPEEVYDLVSDVRRTGEWSPICTGCEWDDGDGPVVGARFTGNNSVPGRTWQTVSHVVVAERGVEFAWMVGQSYVRWSYTFAPVDGATMLTESWEFTPAGLAMFHDKYGSGAADEIAVRTRAAHDGIPATLAAIKRIAES